MTAAEIARALGGERQVGQWWSCRCPAHHDRTPSLSLLDGDRGIIVRCFAGCEARDVLAELRRRGLIEDRAVYHRSARNRSRPEVPKIGIKDRSLEIQHILRNSRPAAGTMIEIYLRSRGLTLPDCPDLLYHNCLTDLTGARGWPAMVAVVRNPLSGEVLGVHRTYLAINGAGKAPIATQKAMLGPCCGGAVILKPADEVLGVGEGIETCTAVLQACAGLPIWAALTTSGLKALQLPPLPLARTVIILCDHDRNGAGENAARVAARRWLREGREVRLATPPEPDTDFADVMLGRAPVSLEASGAA